MKFKKYVLEGFKNPMKILMKLLWYLPSVVSDKIYVIIQYKAILGNYPCLSNPKLFTEKIQWLKLYDHNPIYTDMVDKVKVKEYVKNKISKDIIIPTLFICENPDDIDIKKLPDQFVIKCNHLGGGSVFICKDKSKFDFDAVKRQLKCQLRKNSYLKTREWPYKNVKRKILIEKYMVDESGIELKDYKFFCFNGTPKFVEVDFNRFVGHKRNIYDLNWNELNFSMGFPSDYNYEIKEPQNFSKMIEIATKLSEGIPHVRVDLYNINGKIYFGELTFYHDSGFDKFSPEEWNYKLGQLININSIKTNVE